MEEFKKFCRSQSKLQWAEHGIAIGSLSLLALYLIKKGNNFAFLDKYSIYIYFTNLKSFEGMKLSMNDVINFALNNVPGVKSYVDNQTDNIVEELKKDIASKPLPEPRFTHLPEESLSKEEILKILEV